MTTREKNMSIAEMLGWFVRNPEKNGKCIIVELPKSCTLHVEGFGYSQNPKAKKKKVMSIEGDKMVTEFVNWTDAKNLQFHSDANWQLEAINFIIKLKDEKRYFEYIILSNTCGIYCRDSQSGAVYFEAIEYCNEPEEIKEAIFEALYQFSQYLKEKQ